MFFIYYDVQLYILSSNGAPTSLISRFVFVRRVILEIKWIY